MKAVYLSNAIFTPGVAGAGTINLSGISGFDVRNLYLINNVSQNTVVYAAGTQSKGLAGTTGTTVTLCADTTGQNASDILQVLYDANNEVNINDSLGNPIVLGIQPTISSIPVTLPSDLSAIPAYNGDVVLFEPFNTFDTSSSWTIVQQHSGDIVKIEGNAIANSYLTISLDPFGSDTRTVIENNARFRIPLRTTIAFSRNIAALGKEFSIEIVDDAVLDNFTPIQIASFRQATNVALMLSTFEPHGMKVGQCFCIDECLSGSLNYPALVVAAAPTKYLLSASGGPGATTLATNTVLTATTSIVAQSGRIFSRSRMGGAANGISMILESASQTQASFYQRCNSDNPSDTMPGCANANFVNSHVTTIGTYATVAPFTLPNVYSFLPTTQYDILIQPDYIEVSDKAIDSQTVASIRLKRDQLTPDPSKFYKIRFRASSNAGVTRPNVLILSAIKVSSNLATLSTNEPHNFTINDTVNIYGFSNQVSFGNITTAVAICAVPTPTSIVIPMSSVGSGSGQGGYIAKVQGSNLMSTQGTVTQQISSVSRTNNILTLRSGAGTWTSTSIGEFVNIVGCISAGVATGESLNIDGPYRVQNLVANILILEPINNVVSITGADFEATNCGGAILRRNDLRINYIRAIKFAKQMVESYSGYTRNDAAQATPVYISGPTTMPVSIASTSPVGGGIVRGLILGATNPLTIGGIDNSDRVTPLRVDYAGGVAGPGEVLGTYSFAALGGGLSGIEGLNAKSFSCPARDSVIYLGLSSAPSTASYSVEGTYDNRIFTCIPMSRIDNTAAATAFTSLCGWTGVPQATYRGNSYGYPIIRVHQTAYSSGTSNGSIRIVTNGEIAGQTMTPFTLSGTGTTESVGSANGTIQTGQVKTLAIQIKGASKTTLIIDASTGILQYGLFGSTDEGASYTTLSVTPLSGGNSQFATISTNATSALPTGNIFETDTTGYTHVQIRLLSYTNGLLHGALKSVPITTDSIGDSNKRTYTASVYNLSPTSPLSAMVIQSGATRITSIKRVIIYPGNATTTTTAYLSVVRTSGSAVTGGTQIDSTIMERDERDSVHSGTVKVGAFTVPGVTETLTQMIIPIPTPANTLSPQDSFEVDFTNGGTTKGIRIPAGITNGLLFAHGGAGAGASNFGMLVDFTEI
jgi:hypothetical protein